MIERYVMTLAVGARGEDPQRTKTEGVHVSRRRTATHPHTWRNERCRWCGMHAAWPGAARPCEASCIRAREANEAKHKAVANALRILSGRNEEARPVAADRASVTTTGES